jgi:hypothetical protein
MVADVVTEYGGDAERIASAVKETVKTAFTPTTPSNNDFPPCKNCGGHGCKECTNDPDGSNYDGPPSKDAEAEMPDNLYKDASDRPEHLKAQDEVQLADEHSQVNPWLKKQIQDEDQEDGGNLRNKEANIEDSQPVSKQVPLAEKEGYGGNIEEKLESAPSAIGTGHEAAAHTVEEKGDKFVVVEDGGKEAAGPFNSKEKAQARAKELNELENLEKEAGFGDLWDKAKGALGFGQQQQQTQPQQQTPASTDPLDDEFADLDYEPDPQDWETTGACPECGEQLQKNRNGYWECSDNLGGLGCPWKQPGANEYDRRAIEQQEANQIARQQAEAERAQRQKQYDYDQEQAKRNQEQQATENYKRQQQRSDEQMGMPYRANVSTTPAMAKALALKEAAARGEKRNFFAAKPETGDSTENNESLPTGNEDAHDGPSPKMDKTRWKPNATNPDGNLKPIDTEGEYSPHPTRQMDIKQKPDYQNDDPWEHDNNVWEREQLPTADDNAGFDDTRNIEQLPTKTFPDKNQTNPVTREALAGNEKVAIFEDERDILEENVPEDYAPSREGIMSELADLKQRLIDGGSSPEEAEAEIKDLVMGMWRTEQSPEELGEIGIEDMRSEFDAPVEEIEIEEVPEEIEEIIERGDDDEDRVEVIHDHEEDEDEDLLGFDDPEKLELEEDEDLPFDEELSEEELDRLLEEEDKKDHDDEDLFL